MKLFFLKNIRTILYGLLMASIFYGHALADTDAIYSSDNAVWGSVGGSYFDYRETDDSGATADTERG